MAHSARKQLSSRVKDYPYIVLVMRHGEAQDRGKHGDFDRELSDKGKKQAKRVAKGLDHCNIIPDAIVCSPAKRASQTMDRLLKRFGDKPRVDLDKDLYDGGIDAIMQQLRQARQSTHTLMIIGHEPIVSMACQWIANPKTSSDAEGMLGIGLSTGSVVVLGSKQPISQWSVRSADVLAVLRPKDLAD